MPWFTARPSRRRPVGSISFKVKCKLLREQVSGLQHDMATFRSQLEMLQSALGVRPTLVGP